MKAETQLKNIEAILNDKELVNTLEVPVILHLTEKRDELKKQINTAMKAENAILEIEQNFTEKQIRVIKATINGGGWGTADFELNNGETICGWGYPTEDAKETIKDLTPRQIAGVFSGIAKTIAACNFDFIQHIPDYWGEGNASDGMLFFAYSIDNELRAWAKQ